MGVFQALLLYPSACTAFLSCCRWLKVLICLFILKNLNSKVQVTLAQTLTLLCSQQCVGLGREGLESIKSMQRRDPWEMQAIPISWVRELNWKRIKCKVPWYIFLLYNQTWIFLWANCSFLLEGGIYCNHYSFLCMSHQEACLKTS